MALCGGKEDVDAAGKRGTIGAQSVDEIGRQRRRAQASGAADARPFEPPPVVGQRLDLHDQGRGPVGIGGRALGERRQRRHAPAASAIAAKAASDGERDEAGAGMEAQERRHVRALAERVIQPHRRLDSRRA